MKFSLFSDRKMYWTCTWDHLSNAATSLLGSLHTSHALSSWLGVICWVGRVIDENAFSSILGWGRHHFKLCKRDVGFFCFYFIFFLTVRHILGTVKSNFVSIQCDEVKDPRHFPHTGFQLLKTIAVFVCFACLCFWFSGMISQTSVQNQANLSWLFHRCPCGQCFGTISSQKWKVVDSLTTH